MIYLQIYDIPRLAAEGGGNLAEILGIVAVAVVGALVFWIIKLDKQKNEMMKYQQDNDKMTLTALNSVTSVLNSVKEYLPEMKGDIKDKIDTINEKMEHTKTEIITRIERR